MRGKRKLKKIISKETNKFLIVLDFTRKEIDIKEEAEHKKETKVQEINQLKRIRNKTSYVGDIDFVKTNRWLKNIELKVGDRGVNNSSTNPESTN